MVDDVNYGKNLQCRFKTVVNIRNCCQLNGAIGHSSTTTVTKHMMLLQSTSVSLTEKARDE